MSTLSANSLFNVEGMVIVITGGGSGIGAMMANALDANGAAKVYILGRREERLKEIADKALNKSIIPVKCDVSIKQSLADAVARIESETPFVNVVIANSGSQGPTVYGLPKDRTPSLDEMYQYLWKTSYEEFNEAFEVNSTAAFYTMVAFMPLLDQGNNHKSSPSLKTDVKSQFIITGSIGSLSRRPGMGFAYSASKAAAGLMMRQISTMMAPYHIRANILNPGIYPSDMSAAFMGGKDGSQLGSVAANICPATRTGTDEDMAGATLFLCSRAGSYINGLVLNTDGGRLGIVPATY